MILCDYEIKDKSRLSPMKKKFGIKPMIDPFVEDQVATDDNGNKIVSYGLSSFGYDVRLYPEYMVFNNVESGIIDPLDFNPNTTYIKKTGDSCIIPPNSYILSRTIETFTIPKDVLGVCVGKSTYARCGVSINVTPLEPGFEGTVTLEIANSTPLPVKVYANMGIAQFVFFRGSEPSVTYDMGNRKYMNQHDVTPAKV